MTSSRPIQWGVLSTARIGVTAFIPSARATPGAQVYAVASRSQATADAFARDHDIPVALGSYQALLDHPDIDAVYISLPNSLHAEWTNQSRRGLANTSFAKNPSPSPRPKAGKWSRLAARPTCCSLRPLSLCTIPKAAVSRKLSPAAKSAPCATLTPA